MEASQRSAECQADCHRFDGSSGKMQRTVSCVVGRGVRRSVQLILTFLVKDWHVQMRCELVLPVRRVYSIYVCCNLVAMLY